MKGFPSDPFSVVIGTGVYPRGMLWRFSSKKQHRSKKPRSSYLEGPEISTPSCCRYFPETWRWNSASNDTKKDGKKFKNVVYPWGGFGCSTCWALPKHWKTSGFCDSCRVLATPNVSNPKKKNRPKTAFGPSNGRGVGSWKNTGCFYGFMGLLYLPILIL